MIAFSSASVKLVLFFMLIGGRIKVVGPFDVSDANTKSSDSGDEGGETLLTPVPGLNI